RSRKIVHLSLSPDQHLRDVNIQLTPAGVITGRIYDQNRQPLPSVSIEALRYQYREGVRVFVSAGQGMSDDRGEYRIFNLQPGAYYVRATLPNPSQNLSAPVYYPGVVDPQDGSRITVVPGAESSAIDIPFGGNKTSSIRIKVSAAVQSGGPQPTTFYVVR